MANVSSTPKFSGMKYRVVNELGAGAGSKIFLISDKTAGGKRYALKIVRKNEPEEDIYIQQARTEYEAAQKLNHPVIAKVYDFRLRKSWLKVTGCELLLDIVGLGKVVASLRQFIGDGMHRGSPQTAGIAGSGNSLNTSTLRSRNGRSNS